MTWKGRSPEVLPPESEYPNGVKLSQTRSKSYCSILSDADSLPTTGDRMGINYQSSYADFLKSKSFSIITRTRRS